MRGFDFSSAQRIDCGDISEMGGQVNFSMSMWFRRMSLGDACPIGQYTGGAQQIGIVAHTDGKVYCQVRSGDGYPNFASNDTDLHHVVMVYDGSASGQAKILAYFDGEPEALTYGGGNPTTTQTPNLASSFSIGDRGTSGQYGNGRIGEVKIWTATLTAGEVRSDFTGVTPQRDKLIGWWPCGYGSPEPDYSGLGNEGVLVNAPTIEDHAPVTMPLGFDAWVAEISVAALGNPYYYFAQMIRGSKCI